MNVALDELRDTTRKAILTYGYSEEEANILLDVLLYAQLRGNNQGIVKLIGAGIPKSHDAGPIDIVHETSLSARINGNQNHGMIVLNRAVDKALEKAGEHGFGIVGTRNTATSTGAIGYFAARIADTGLIGTIFAGSPGSVAFHGSSQPIFGTNPLAIGIPARDTPIIFDMSTSAIARYGVVEAQTAGAFIPDGVALDQNGNPTTDPAEALQGAILPFGGYKGAALNMIVEVLTGPLVGAAFAGVGNVRGDWGTLVMAIDPELLMDRDEFQENVALLVKQAKATKKLPGVAEILVPGERGNRIRQAAEQSGSIEVEDNLWAELQKVASR
jgi:LDH2 family malate/lactate/ureidoglycolate dehydrogenase